MTSFKCVLCKQWCREHGNNAAPIAQGKCCERCNPQVIIRRMRDIQRVQQKGKRSRDQEDDFYSPLQEDEPTSQTSKQISEDTDTDAVRTTTCGKEGNQARGPGPWSDGYVFPKITAASQDEPIGNTPEMGTLPKTAKLNEKSNAWSFQVKK